jgi:hypothetical protein
MKGFQKYVYLIPIIQIIATFAVSFVDLTDNQWVYLGNSVGYSILTGLVYLAYFWNPYFKFCWFTKIAALGLLIIAIYNFLGACFDFKFYSLWFDRIVFVIVLILTFLMPKSND